MNDLTKPNVSLRRRSLHQDLADQVRELIVSCKLQPGTKVPEKELCDMFDVSRTPLREALKVLATEHLVVLEPNRGAWISKITVEDLEEVFPVMGALESLSGELACAKITDDEITHIRMLHDTMLHHFRDRHLAGYFEANQSIHEAILAAARSATLTNHYRGLATRVRRARFVANMTEARWRQATDEHEEIMRCLEARDGPQLARLLRQHLQNKLETVRDWLLQNTDVPE